MNTQTRNRNNLPIIGKTDRRRPWQTGDDDLQVKTFNTGPTSVNTRQGVSSAPTFKGVRLLGTVPFHKRVVAAFRVIRTGVYAQRQQTEQMPETQSVAQVIASALFDIFVEFRPRTAPQTERAPQRQYRRNTARLSTPIGKLVQIGA